MLSFENIIQKILEEFPDFVKSNHYKDADHELQYSFVSAFVSYIMDEINNSEKPETNNLVLRAYELFNSMINSDDKELLKLAVVEVLESLAQEKKSKDLSSELLNSEGNKHLLNVLTYTGTDA